MFPLLTARAVQNYSVAFHCDHIYQDHLNVYLSLKEIRSFSESSSVLASQAPESCRAPKRACAAYAVIREMNADA